MRKEDFKQQEISLPSGVFKVYHNLGEKLESALINWMVRTSNFTVKSLDKYVISKRLGYRVLLEEEYNKLS